MEEVYRNNMVGRENLEIGTTPQRLKRLFAQCKTQQNATIQYYPIDYQCFDEIAGYMLCNNSYILLNNRACELVKVNGKGHGLLNNT